LTEYSFYSGAFTEWTTFFVYASDVFLILACAFWLISKNFFRSDKKSKYLNNKFKKVTKLPKAWLLLLAFLVWVTLSLVINNDYLKISVFQTVKLIELSLLVIFVYFNLKNSKILFNSLFVLVFSGFLQSLVAIYQFIAQHSVFTSPILAKITGESIIGPQIPGVAKIIVDGEKIIRAYGTFPHPNILGGFLILTILITICLYLEHKKGILSSKLRLRIHSEGEQTLICLCLAQISKFSRLFQYNNTNSVKSQGIAYFLLWITLIFVQTTALFFTFSRTAWAGFLLSLLIMIIFYFCNYKIVSRETIDKDCSSQGRGRLGGIVLEKLSLPLWQRGLGGFCEDSQGINLKFNSIVSRETISKINNNVKNTVIKFKELFIAFLLLIFLIISNFSIIQARIGDDLLSNGRLPDNSAISDRSFYNNVSRETISENFVFGSGLGTYIFQIDDFVRNKEINQILQPWQYQPAHNIYLLFASEVGAIGLIFFFLFMVYVILGSIKIVSRETILDIRKLNYFLIAILVSFLFIGLFDHYFWTLQQGRLMFWLILGLILVGSNISSGESEY